MSIDETVSRKGRAELRTADQQQVSTGLQLQVRDRLGDLVLDEDRLAVDLVERSRHDDPVHVAEDLSEFNFERSDRGIGGVESVPVVDESLVYLPAEDDAVGRAEVRVGKAHQLVVDRDPIQSSVPVRDEAVE